jgi:hypothetical protein
MAQFRKFRFVDFAFLMVCSRRPMRPFGTLERRICTIRVLVKGPAGAFPLVNLRVPKQ